MKKLNILLLLILIGCSDNSGSSEADCTTNPTLKTEEATEITDTTAKLKGSITAPTCESTVTSQGFVYAMATLPKIDDNVAEVNGQNVSATIIDLEPNTTYYYRTFFTNPTGTYYGNENTFSTEIGNTIISTQDITNITSFAAKSGGNIDSDGGSAITSRGVCWNTAGNPSILDNLTVDGEGAGLYESNIDGLDSYTEYYVKAYAINENGTVYGEEKTFTTLPTLATIITSEVTDITYNSATGGGSAVDNGGANIIDYGVVWSSDEENLTIDNNEGITNDGNGNGIYTSQLDGLIPCRTYYIRAYATNSVGTAYGDIVSFTTLALGYPGSGLTDIDGNDYETVIIGNQEWMASNLKVSRYRNGDIIPQVINGWGNLAEGAWCYLYNDPSNDPIRGKMYNWYAVNDQRGIAPEGWHVPTVDEVLELTENLGGIYEAGGLLKSTGTIEDGTGLWAAPNTGATNCTGFNAIPSGYRSSEAFDPTESITRADYWTSEEGKNWVVVSYNNQLNVQNMFIFYGTTIRLIKD